MNSERWQQVETVFHAALKRSPPERCAFLAEACVGDEPLRGEVEALLSAHQCAGDFLESPTFESESLTGLTTLVAGQTFGHYRILDLLGEGGMGEVYLAEDTRLGRRVALKLLPSQLEKGETRIRRFEREARAAAALCHPNVCVVHEVDETADGHHFIAMEHVEGETLRERIGRDRMNLGEALDTAMQVASALAAAHEAGIVHRDIKPENIMLRPDGQIKVLDFGLAKLTERQSAFLDPDAATKRLAKTAPGMIMGTVSYMSPEQVRGSPHVDARADIWSLGVLLFEMLTGRTPFEGATPSHTMVAITDQEAPPLSRYVQRAPEALEEVVKVALAKDPDARYQTAGQMLAVLKKLKHRIEAGLELGRCALPESAASETTTDTVVTKIKRYKRGLALVLAAVFVAVAVQQDIAPEIAERLGLRLTGEEQRRVVKSYTHNADAYRLYLQGRYFWNQRTEEGLKNGIKYFEQAIERDPHYAPAYSGLADCYTTLGYLSSLPPHDSFPKAKAAATKALELDSTLAEPHTSLAYARFYYDWDWEGADTHFKEAIKLNRNYATAHHWYSVYLTARERHADALVEIQRAQELDPDSLIIATDIGFESFYSGRYDEAIKQLQSVLAMKQDFPLASLWLGRAYQEKAMYEQAVAEYQKAEAALPSWVPAKAAIGNAYGLWGKENLARQVLDELDELAKEKYVTPYGTALVRAGLGETDQAFAALNQAYDERSHWLVWLKLDLRWGELRTDPRFGDLVRRIGLPR